MVIKDTHSDTGLCGQIGVVRGVNPGMCAVFLPDEARTVNIAPDHLQPVVPVRGDKVKVIMGECRWCYCWAGRPSAVKKLLFFSK